MYSYPHYATYLTTNGSHSFLFAPTDKFYTIIQIHFSHNQNYAFPKLYGTLDMNSFYRKQLLQSGPTTIIMCFYMGMGGPNVFSLKREFSKTAQLFIGFGFFMSAQFVKHGIADK